jgi:hypothetical protein
VMARATDSSTRWRRIRAPRSSMVNHTSVRPSSTAAWPSASQKWLLPVPDGPQTQSVSLLRTYSRVFSASWVGRGIEEAASSRRRSCRPKPARLCRRREELGADRRSIPAWMNVLPSVYRYSVPRPGPCTTDNVTAGSHITPAPGFAWLHGLHDGVPKAVGAAPRGGSDRRQVTRRKPIASRGRGTSDRAPYPVRGVPSTRGWSRKRRSHSSLNQGVKASGAHAISARRACGMT